MDDASERDFVERTALLLESTGLPRIHGRLMGRLLVCDPPEQSLGELASWLGVSKGAVSPAARQLVTMGRIEEVARPGREVWYRIDPAAWVGALQHDLRRIGAIREHADAGLRLLEGESDARRGRLRELRDLNAWMEVRLPEVLDEWIARRSRR